ncbi:MAG: RNA helicase [Chloroflexi bacterium GWB2_49_20]|nr:MAG: RNA helicase [Chloroflexi bacterium GWB2_49_20]OGN78198.1 MAG: RNA helicase [Chloroflexi bacterium GWC2_49_37]OGN85234.1 MAG: RNA helicase [Chloroflexi bacterium GWD2_49_16]
MTSDFNEMNLHQQLVQAVLDCGYTTPTPIQSKVIPILLTGQDVLGQAKTGTGKTAAFALPILNNLIPNQNHIQALVVAPTRELAMQVANSFNKYGKISGARVLAVYGGQPYSPQITHLKKGVDIVVGTPGRLLDLIDRNVLDLSQVNTLVLDEADEMLSMGFIEDIESILKHTPANRQTALFSATLPSGIQKLAKTYMKDPQSITIKADHLTVDSIEQRYYLINEHDKLAALSLLFEVEPITRALIFVRTRAGTGDLTNALNSRGFPAETLNGDLAQDARERVVARFRNNQIKVLVATDVAARGLDIDDISHVINFDLPDEIELYVHRIGRTGRAGKTGISLTLLTPKELWRLRRIEGFTNTRITRASLPTEQDVQNHRQKQLVDQVVVWLKRARFTKEREIVSMLVEAGYQMEDIAAAALKIARAEEKQRPITSVIEAQESRPNKSIRTGNKRNGEKFSPRSKTSHEAGMVRLSISKGRSHGVRPNDIVSTIAYFADIPGNSIGKIVIEDKLTWVDVPEQYVAQVLSNTGNYKLRQHSISIQRA